MTLPDFLVIGAYKSGTTALHDILRAHPQVFIPRRKEPNYFAFADGAPATNPAVAKSVIDRSQYEALFADRGDARVAGEVSPEYLANPAACTAIAREIPYAKLVAILRDPVDRAYSDYLMYRREGLESEAFERAIELQDERQRRGDPTGFYVATGFYGRQLQPYLETFPSSQILVLLHDDLVRDRNAALRALFAFLGVDPIVVGGETRPNISGVPESALLRLAYALRRRAARQLGPIVPDRIKRAGDAALQRRLARPELAEATAAGLWDTYRDDVRLLEDMLGRDLSHWQRRA